MDRRIETIALVGPSGTGKSHRAGEIAYLYNTDLIIDDGLLIEDGKIVAGQSAKREETMVKAVRRAIFVDPSHAEEARATIARLRPQRILVLGTSLNMIDRICSALELPPPALIRQIAEVASPSEIRRALRARRERGRHVIPAPTLEVKKKFSGYLVDSLKVLLAGPGEGDRELEKSVVRPTYSSLGRFTIDQGVLETIAARAAETVEGTSRVLRVRIDSGLEGVEISLELQLRYGYRLPDLLAECQERVKETVEHMTALNVLRVDTVARRLVID